jgi:hypothetical protein
MSDRDTCSVISMAGYLARKGRLGQTNRRRVRRASPGASDTDGGSQTSRSESPVIIPFPTPWTRPPAA